MSEQMHTISTDFHRTAHYLHTLRSTAQKHCNQRSLLLSSARSRGCDPAVLTWPVPGKQSEAHNLHNPGLSKKPFFGSSSDSHEAHLLGGPGLHIPRQKPRGGIRMSMPGTLGSVSPAITEAVAEFQHAEGSCRSRTKQTHGVASLFLDPDSGADCCPGRRSFL